MLIKLSLIYYQYTDRVDYITIRFHQPPRALNVGRYFTGVS